MECPLSYNMETHNPWDCTKECAWHDKAAGKCEVVIIAANLMWLAKTMNDIATLTEIARKGVQ